MNTQDRTDRTPERGDSTAAGYRKRRPEPFTDKQRIDAIERGKVVIMRGDFDDEYEVLGPLVHGARVVYSQAEFGTLRKTIDAAILNEENEG